MKRVSLMLIGLLLPYIALAEPNTEAQITGFERFAFGDSAALYGSYSVF